MNVHAALELALKNIVPLCIDKCMAFYVSGYAPSKTLTPTRISYPDLPKGGTYTYNYT